MKKSIIFCFTGTGNSLQVAIDVSSFLSNCIVHPMTKIGTSLSTHEYEYIGFVFPVYFFGLPLQVERFISSLLLEQDGEHNTPYFFALATCGRSPGNALHQAHHLLQKKGNALHYGQKIIMGSNYVVLYDVSKDLDKEEQKYREQLPSLISALREKRTNTIEDENALITLQYKKAITQLQKKDEGYHVSESCNGCRICGTVCSVHNIEYISNKPVFLHHCEQCVACINYCPQQAIQYEDKTQNRGRYHNPNISWQTLRDLYSSVVD